MDNNINNNEVKKSNNSKLIIIILTILLICALGFICYDKFINTEKPPVPTPTPTEKDNKLTKLNMIELTNDNQEINVGGKTFTVLSQLEDGTLFINNSQVFTDKGLNISANKVYVTDNFAFFTGYGQFDSSIEYAIDSNGNPIKVDIGNMYIHDIQLENGVIVGIGMDAVKALDENNTETEGKLVIKYENNTITIEPFK